MPIRHTLPLEPFTRDQFKAVMRTQVKVLHDAIFLVRRSNGSLDLTDRMMPDHDNLLMLSESEMRDPARTDAVRDYIVRELTAHTTFANEGVTEKTRKALQDYIDDPDLLIDECQRRFKARPVFRDSAVTREHFFYNVLRMPGWAQVLMASSKMNFHIKPELRHSNGQRAVVTNLAGGLSSVAVAIGTVQFLHLDTVVSAAATLATYGSISQLPELAVRRARSLAGLNPAKDMTGSASPYSPGQHTFYCRNASASSLSPHCTRLLLRLYQDEKNPQVIKTIAAIIAASVSEFGPPGFRHKSGSRGRAIEANMSAAPLKDRPISLIADAFQIYHREYDQSYRRLLNSRLPMAERVKKAESDAKAALEDDMPHVGKVFCELAVPFFKREMAKAYGAMNIPQAQRAAVGR